ncbi:MAG: thioredoxin family protein [Bacteroidales bacterium]|nr:thioredoxin family protein [Bacteroidales bacterium]
MSKLRFLIVSVFVLALSGMVQAQMLNPVKWTVSVQKISETEANIVCTATMDPGWHLYSQYVGEGGPLPTVLTFEPNSSYKLLGKPYEYPKAHVEYDQTFEMDVGSWAGSASFTQRIKLLKSEKFTITGIIEYMTCNEGSCIPLDYDLSVNVDGTQYSLEESGDESPDSIAVDSIPIDTITPDTAGTNATTNLGDDTDENDLANSSLWSIFIIAFLSGLIAIFTPCVLPMVPMTVTFFLKGSENKSKGRRQAFFFGFSIIVIFTVIGSGLSIIFGPTLFQWLSTHWLPNILFFLIFMIFAFSFFGMFEIKMPSGLINKSDQQADKGGLFGPFFMALTLVLVSFSCTVPIIGAVVVMLSNGEFLQPIVAMFGFGLAFAVPFTLFALFPRWLGNLPKSGGWMNTLKVVLGFIEVALGLKFLSVADMAYGWHLLDRQIYLALWIVIFSLLGLYLLGKLKFKHDGDEKHIGVPKLMLAIISLSFAIYMLPGMFGAPIKILSGFLPPQTTNEFDVRDIVREEIEISQFAGGNSESHICTTNPKYSEDLELPHGLEGYFDLEEGLACAKEMKMPIFIDFTGKGCVNCRKMENNVWVEPEVLKRLRNDYIIVSLYTDYRHELPEDEWVSAEISYSGKVIKDYGKKNQDIQIRNYGQNSQPQYVLLDYDGKKLIKETKAYDADVDDFVRFLDEGLEAFKKREAEKE